MARRDAPAAAWLASIVLVVGLGLAQRASLISIPTAAPRVPNADGQTFCHTAGAGGQLVAHPAWGLAIQNATYPPQLIVWPHDYVGRIAGDHVQLLDDRGRVVARTGDWIEMGGGQTTFEGAQGFAACPVGIRVTGTEP
jgi:hypothetical protein